MAHTFDLVVANGRVMDPESGLDGMRHVGAESLLGSLERGKLADLVVPDANTLEDIANTLKPWPGYRRRRGVLRTTAALRNDEEVHDPEDIH